MAETTSPEINPEIGISVDTGGLSTNYHDAGNGKPVVLIHGSGPGVTAWANWPGISASLRPTSPGSATPTRPPMTAMTLRSGSVISLRFSMRSIWSRYPWSATRSAERWHWRWQSITRNGSTDWC